MGRKPIPIGVRLERRTRKIENGCWLWQGAPGRNDYCQIEIRECDRHKYGGGKMPPVHRVAYIEWVGAIPDGLYIDHLCEVPNCIKPEHLRPASPRENVLRGNTVAAKNRAKDRCPKGHPLQGEIQGRRYCKECRKLSSARYDKRNRKKRNEARRKRWAKYQK